GREVDRRRRALLAAADIAQIDGLTEPALAVADQQDRLISRLEGERGGFGEIIQEANAAVRVWRRYAAAVGLVVERDVAGPDREVERTAGFRNALQAADELAHDFRPF